MSSQPPLKWSYDLAGSTPQVDVAGGSIREANAGTFPALSGNGLAVYLLELEPGAVRIPHWHPDAAELDYVLDGAAVVSIGSPTGDFVRLELAPGMISVIPQGWFHYIGNEGETPMRMLVVFNNDQPNDIGVSEGFRAVPDAVLALTFGVDAARFAGIDRNVGDIAPVSPAPAR